MHFVVKVGTSSFRPLCHENVELINHNLCYTTAATGGEAPDYPWGYPGSPPVLSFVHIRQSSAFYVVVC
jgi:hypothetical protein